MLLWYIWGQSGTHEASNFASGSTHETNGKGMLNSNLIWAKVMTGKYNLTTDWSNLEVRCQTLPSSIWNFMERHRSVLRDDIGWVVCNGSDIKILNDWWVRSFSLSDKPTLFNLDGLPMSYTVQMMLLPLGQMNANELGGFPSAPLLKKSFRYLNHTNSVDIRGWRFLGSSNIISKDIYNLDESKIE